VLVLVLVLVRECRGAPASQTSMAICFGTDEQLPAGRVPGILERSGPAQVLERQQEQSVGDAGGERDIVGDDASRARLPCTSTST
jgi:hypothetical protein